LLIDFDTLEVAKRYKLMSQCIVPRPIAWIVTESSNGLNAAPFSYFAPLSSSPAAVVVSIGHKSDSTPKDTLKNLLQNGKCTICAVTAETLPKMHQTATELDYEIDETKLFGIETKRLLPDFPPIIADTPYALFCTFMQKIDLGGKTVPLILKIENLYISPQNVLDENSLELNIQTVARVGKRYALYDKIVEPPKN